jgi:hypothetical protein
MTFKDISIGGVFVTGPADTLFLKVKHDMNDLRGGNCYEVATGKHIWVPENRGVSLPKQTHFTRAGQEYVWEHTSEAAREHQAKLMAEAGCY